MSSLDTDEFSVTSASGRVTSPAAIRQLAAAKTRLGALGTTLSG